MSEPIRLLPKHNVDSTAPTNAQPKHVSKGAQEEHFDAEGDTYWEAQDSNDPIQRICTCSTFLECEYKRTAPCAKEISFLKTLARPYYVNLCLITEAAKSKTCHHALTTPIAYIATAARFIVHLSS